MEERGRQSIPAATQIYPLLRPSTVPPAASSFLLPWVWKYYHWLVENCLPTFLTRFNGDPAVHQSGPVSRLVDGRVEEGTGQLGWGGGWVWRSTGLRRMKI